MIFSLTQALQATMDAGSAYDQAVDHVPRSILQGHVLLEEVRAELHAVLVPLYLFYCAHEPVLTNPATLAEQIYFLTEMLSEFSDAGAIPSGFEQLLPPILLPIESTKQRLQQIILENRIV